MTTNALDDSQVRTVTIATLGRTCFRDLPMRVKRTLAIRLRPNNAVNWEDLAEKLGVDYDTRQVRAARRHDLLF